MAYVVGLSGGIGSGKSTVADLFAALGAQVVDTDAISHTLTAAGGAAVPAIAQAFGHAFVTPSGALHRTAMRQRAFEDPAARQRLEAILHPLIRAEADARMSASTAPYTILVVPLLVETGNYRQRVDRVLVVDCDPATQVARVMARSGLSAAEVQRILVSQASREARLAAADDVIVNDGPQNKLPAEVERLHLRYLEAAQRKSSGAAQTPPEPSL